MAKPWINSYPAGIPATIEHRPERSLRDVIEESCRDYPRHAAFSNFGTTISYRRLDALSRDFGAWLQQAGLRKGDRVALMMPNLLQYPVALYGVLRAGMTVVNVNPMFTASELAFQLRDSGARAIVLLENFAHTLAAVEPRLPLEIIVITAIGDLLGPLKGPLANLMVRHRRGEVPSYRLPGAVRFRRVLAEGAGRQLERVPLNGDDIALLQYTGGTTGVPKGAILTHGNLVANLQQVEAWLSIAARPGEEVIVTALPLYHIFSLTANCLTFGQLGGHNVLITDPRDLPGMVKTLRRYRITAMTGVNTLFNGLLHTPGFADLDFSRLHMVLAGGMALQASVAEHWQRVTGSPLFEAYGLTETSPAVCIDPLDLTRYNHSAGLPLPSTEISVRDEAGKALPAGEDGELWIRGPQVTQGYWQRPDETEIAITPDGWLRSGDIGHIDDQGYVYIADRKKDMILVSGFNVYPNEVEDVVAGMPGVREVVAVSMPDAKSGEVVKLFVVPEDPVPTREAIVARCREHLARYKVPREVEFRDSLPKSNVGKILRRELRE